MNIANGEIGQPLQNNFNRQKKQTLNSRNIYPCYLFLIQRITNLQKWSTVIWTTCKCYTSFQAVVWDSLNDSGLSNETRALSSCVMRKSPLNINELIKITQKHWNLTFFLKWKNYDPDLKSTLLLKINSWIVTFRFMRKKIVILPK